MTGAGRAQAPGSIWEARACEHLREAGMHILARGYRCRLGELDLVASDGERLVVVEVRARAKSDFGSALETVGPRKQQRIVLATRHFLMRNPAWHSRPIRFDVIAFDAIDSSAPQITWLKNAFTAH
jgi:putative endonuclease